MCGISGFSTLNSADNLRERLVIASHCLAHRGPDDSGGYFSSSQNVGLGHTRLAILEDRKSVV